MRHYRRTGKFDAAGSEVIEVSREYLMACIPSRAESAYRAGAALCVGPAAVNVVVLMFGLSLVRAAVAAVFAVAAVVCFLMFRKLRRRRAEFRARAEAE